MSFENRKKQRLSMRKPLVYGSLLILFLSYTAFANASGDPMGGIDMENTPSWVAIDVDGDGDVDQVYGSGNQNGCGYTSSFYPAISDESGRVWADLDRNGSYETFLGTSAGVKNYHFSTLRNASMAAEQAVAANINAVKDGVSLTTRSMAENIRQGFAYNRRDLSFSPPPPLTSSLATNEVRLQKLISTLQENGPIAVQNDEYRVWLSPYFVLSRTLASQEDPGSRNGLMGTSTGAEYRSDKYAYTIGLILGVNKGKQAEVGRPNTNTKYKGLTYGIYHSKGLWEGGRYDVLVLKTINKMNLSRESEGRTPSPVVPMAYGKNRIYSDVIDLQTSHVHKFDDTWSIRPDIGHTYIASRSSAYSETGSAVVKNQVHTLRMGSYELYGGLGLRWNHRGETLRTRVTGVYEYGFEWKKTGGMMRTSPLTTPSLVFDQQDKTKAKTHYFALNSSFLNENTKWKYIIGYNGTKQKNTVSHSLSLKVEYRW